MPRARPRRQPAALFIGREIALQDFCTDFREQQIVERMRRPERVPVTRIRVEMPAVDLAVIRTEIDGFVVRVVFVEAMRKNQAAIYCAVKRALLFLRATL